MHNFPLSFMGGSVQRAPTMERVCSAKRGFFFFVSCISFTTYFFGHCGESGNFQTDLPELKAGMEIEETERAIRLSLLENKNCILKVLHRRGVRREESSRGWKI